MSLNQILSEPDLSVPELFKRPDISNMIKSKMQIFVQYCKRNQDFTKIMMSMGIKTPMHCNQSIDMRRIACAISDVLTCDNDAIASLFIIQDAPQRVRLYSQSEDQLFQEIESNEASKQQTTADHTSKQNKQVDQFQKKYMFLLDLLSYLNQQHEEQNLDENCINYIMKVLNTIIRVKPEQLFQFFMERMEILKKMVELTNYPSICYSIAKLINEGEDQKYRNVKNQIIKMFIEQLISKTNSNNFNVYAEFIEDIFQKSRHRSEQQDQIKIVTQPLMDQKIVNIMVQGVLSQENQQQTSNCLTYLLKLAERMNMDQQHDPYSYGEQSNKPTMDFQVDCIYNNLDKLIAIASTFTRQRYSATQILTYYDFILCICNNSRFKNANLPTYDSILILLEALAANQANSNGIIKNKIIFIIQKLFAKSLQQKQQVKQMKTKAELKISNLNQQVSGLCYKQKLTLLFAEQINENLGNIYTKYSSLLAPTVYTQNRNFKIKQLQFVKSYKANKQKLNNQTKQPNGDVPHKEEPSIQNKIDNEKESNSSLPNSISLNFNLLNDKINAKKSKKQHAKQDDQSTKKTPQQGQKQPQKDQKQCQSVTVAKQQKQNQQVQIKKEKAQKNKQNQQQKQKQKNKQKNKQRQKLNGTGEPCGKGMKQDGNKPDKFVPYYVKYLILF